HYVPHGAMCVLIQCVLVLSSLFSFSFVLPFFFSVSDRVDFAAEEHRVLKYWSDIEAFETSLKQSEGKPIYTFYDGPPFATGLPHYGHILAGTIKDTVTRYAHQTGHHVVRRFGW